MDPPATATTTRPWRPFWATLKRELNWIHGPLIYMNRGRLRSALFDYIEIFYNRERAQAGHGHLSPL